MSPNELFRLQRKRPFEPYRLYLTDGSYFDVMHPEMMMVSVRTSVIGVPNLRNSEIPEELAYVDNLHITKIVPLTAITA